MEFESDTRLKAGRAKVKILVVVTFLTMIVMNILANALPLNGRTTGAVSDAYPNLFAPAGITFSIWGVIYLLLGAHVLYQLLGDRDAEPVLLNRVGILFSVSSLANAGWVLAWHYDYIALSVVLIVVILACLASIVSELHLANLTGRRRWLVGLPFSVYFGWITVAVVANVTVWLVSARWDGFGFADSTWAVIVPLVVMTIGILTMFRNRDVAYGLVLIWAFSGILIRQISGDELAGRYPAIIVAVSASIVILLVGEGWILRRHRAAAA